MKCFDCYFTPCVCQGVDPLLEENHELTEDLAEIESEIVGSKRCVSCFFFNCKCKKGHANRLKQ